MLFSIVKCKEIIHISEMNYMNIFSNTVINCNCSYKLITQMVYHMIWKILLSGHWSNRYLFIIYIILVTYYFYIYNNHISSSFLWVKLIFYYKLFIGI